MATESEGLKKLTEYLNQIRKQAENVGGVSDNSLWPVHFDDPCCRDSSLHDAVHRLLEHPHQGAAGRE